MTTWPYPGPPYTAKQLEHARVARDARRASGARPLLSRLLGLSR
jgi:hypothetical protein